MVDENKLFHAKNQMDRETIREFERGVPTSVARDIARDHIGKSTSLPMSGVASSGLPNFVEPKPLETPPGIAIVDQLMAQEDRLWRRELAQRLGEKVTKDEPPSAA